MGKTQVTLRIFGPGLDPERVTRMLGRAPSAAEREGEDSAGHGPAGRGRAQHDSWRLSAEPRSPGDLDGQIRDLLGGLSQDLGVWAELAAAWRIDLFCGLFLADANEGLPLSPETLRMIAERGIALELDIYGPPPGRGAAEMSQEHAISDAEPVRPKSMLVVGSLAEIPRELEDPVAFYYLIETGLDPQVAHEARRKFNARAGEAANFGAYFICGREPEAFARECLEAHGFAPPAAGPVMLISTEAPWAFQPRREAAGSPHEGLPANVVTLPLDARGRDAEAVCWAVAQIVKDAIELAANRAAGIEPEPFEEDD